MKKLLFLYLTVCSLAFCQAVRVDPTPVMTTATNVPPGAMAPVLAIPGATVHVCEYPANGAPCTNYATTYTDPTETTACPTNAQLVMAGTTDCVATTDQQGNYGFWVAPGPIYTYTITIPTGQSFGPYEFTPIVQGSSGSVIYNEGSTGAVNRTVTSRLQDILSVKDFGAKGDCSTDDTAAIQNAVNAATSTGKALYFPGLNPTDGECYKITNTITISDYVLNSFHLYGDGKLSSLITQFGNNIPIFTVTAVGSPSGNLNIHYWEIDHLQMTYNSSQTPTDDPNSSMIELGSSTPNALYYGWHIHHLLFGTGYRGITLASGSADAFDWHIDHVTGSHGMTGSLIRMLPSGAMPNCTINDFFSGGTPGVQVEPPIVLSSCNELNITNAEFDAGWHTQVQLVTMNTVNITQVHLEGQTMDAANQSLIILSQVKTANLNNIQVNGIHLSAASGFDQAIHTDTSSGPVNINGETVHVQDSGGATLLAFDNNDTTTRFSVNGLALLSSNTQDTSFSKANGYLVLEVLADGSDPVSYHLNHMSLSNVLNDRFYFRSTGIIDNVSPAIGFTQHAAGEGCWTFYREGGASLWFPSQACSSLIDGKSAISFYTYPSTAVIGSESAATLQFSIDANGGATATGVVSGTYFLPTTGAPTITTAAGAGTGPTGVSVTGNNTSGVITLTTGTSPGSNSQIGQIQFASAFGRAPNCVIYGRNAAAAASNSFVNTSATTSFNFTANASALSASTQYIWTYICSE